MVFSRRRPFQRRPSRFEPAWRDATDIQNVGGKKNPPRKNHNLVFDTEMIRLSWATICPPPNLMTIPLSSGLTVITSMVGTSVINTYVYSTSGWQSVINARVYFTSGWQSGINRGVYQTPGWRSATNALVYFISGWQSGIIAFVFLHFLWQGPLTPDCRGQVTRRPGISMFLLKKHEKHS